MLGIDPLIRRSKELISLHFFVIITTKSLTFNFLQSQINKEITNSPPYQIKEESWLKQTTTLTTEKSLTLFMWWKTIRKIAIAIRIYCYCPIVSLNTLNRNYVDRRRCVFFLKFEMILI